MKTDHQQHSPAALAISDEFPPVDYAAWRSLVEQSLGGADFDRKLVSRLYEGISLQPVYTRQDQLAVRDPYGFPGRPPFVRGTQAPGVVAGGWDLRQEHADPQLALTRQAIRDDVRGGATSLLLTFDRAAQTGLDPGWPEAADLACAAGVAVYQLPDLEAILADVDLSQTAIALHAGAAFLPAAALLLALWKKNEVSADHSRGSFGADPLAVLAAVGSLPADARDLITQASNLAVWTSQHRPHVAAMCVDTAPYHHAGATATQDIALGVATAVEYLRAMTAAGLSVGAAAAQIEFRVRVGTHHFLSIAKLRALRRVWSHIAQACGDASAAGRVRIHAQVSDRVLTQRDPYVNLLRNTAAAFSACIGGVDAITSAPFDKLLGLPDEFSRRIARNTMLILQEEGHLHRVADPAGGSWFLDQLTEQLAGKAWRLFQEIERRGGMRKSLECGWVADEIGAALAPRAKDIARRKEGITGVSEFPNIGEEPVSRAAASQTELREAAASRVREAQQQASCAANLETLASAADKTSAALDAALAGASIGQMAQALGYRRSPRRLIAPLAPRRLAAPFERLRDASDFWQSAHGRRPTVFLVNLGPLAHFTARAAYAKNFFEAGGFAVLGESGFATVDAAAEAFKASGATIAVICSSDKLYPEFVPSVAGLLKAKGARSVVLAGHPGDNEATWRAAGVDRFIFMKCDVLATLEELLREEGVLG